MQEHVELEVSLEIIMAQIAEAIFELENISKEDKLNKEENLMKIINLQEEAYKGNREVIKKILEGDY